MTVDDNQQLDRKRQLDAVEEAVAEVTTAVADAANNMNDKRQKTQKNITDDDDEGGGRGGGCPTGGTPPRGWTQDHAQTLCRLVEHERGVQWRHLQQANPLNIPWVPLEIWISLPLDDDFTGRVRDLMGVVFPNAVTLFTAEQIRERWTAWTTEQGRCRPRGRMLLLHGGGGSGSGAGEDEKRDVGEINSVEGMVKMER